ncbi:MAG: phosphatidylserine decarboxylase family protein, partial [Micromonospora sp.]
MTQSPAVRTPGPSGPVRIGERAARTLVAELARRHDPKTALLVGAA